MTSSLDYNEAIKNIKRLTQELQDQEQKTLVAEETAFKRFEEQTLLYELALEEIENVK